MNRKHRGTIEIEFDNGTKVCVTQDKHSYTVKSNALLTDIEAADILNTVLQAKGPRVALGIDKLSEILGEWL